MHAPYVEEKHPGEMFTYNPKAFGQGAQGILPHPLYGNPMQSGVPPKTLLPMNYDWTNKSKRPSIQLIVKTV